MGLGAWRRLPIADRIANETFITKADVDWFSEQLLFSLLALITTLALPLTPRGR